MKKSLRLAYFDPDELRANPKNWRNHPARQTAALESVLDDVGWAGAALLNERKIEDGWNKREAVPTLIDGHLRQLVASHRGQKIPVLVGSWSPEQERKILLTFDPLSAMAEADDGKLRQLLDGFDADGALAEVVKDLQSKLTPDEDIRDAHPQIDRAEELREKWGTRSGQLWKLGEHRLLCGDSTKREDVERVMGDEKAGAVVTDPPYGVGVNFPDYKDTPGGLENLIRVLFPVFFEMTRGPIVWFGAAVRVVDDLRIFPKRPDRILIWNVTFSLAHTASNGIFYHWHPIYVWQIPKRHDGPKLDVISEVRGGHNNWNHPSTKALPVINSLVGFCGERENVFDPFLGSGTTLVSCQNLNRRGRGIEISPAYVAVSLQRFEDAFGITGELIE